MQPLRVLVFQHQPCTPLEMFGGFLQESGITPQIVDFDRGDAIPDLENYDALIVLGGPMNVWETEAHPWLIPEKAAIRQWVKTLDKPMLGICLGHQLLADALDGEVRLAARPEADVSTIQLTPEGQRHPLMAGFAPAKKAINMHGCEVTQLPAGGIRLASTDNCANAAIAVGSAAFGIQYHAEATDTLFGGWAELEGGRALIIDVHGEDAGPRIRERITEAMPELRINAKTIYQNFIAIADRARLANA